MLRAYVTSCFGRFRGNQPELIVSAWSGLFRVPVSGARGRKRTACRGARGGVFQRFSIVGNVPKRQLTRELSQRFEFPIALPHRRSAPGVAHARRVRRQSATVAN